MQTELVRQSINPSPNKTDRVARLASYSRRPFRLLIAKASEVPAIDRVRIEAYKQAGYFTIPHPERVLTRSDPENSFCYVITDGEQIAATMRVTFVMSRAEAVQVIEGRLPENSVKFPGVALCRGATQSAFRGMGLMTYLVSTGVAVAYQAGLQSAVAMQAPGTPHFGAMVRAGWKSIDLKSDSAHTVAVNSTQAKFVYIPANGLAWSNAYSNEAHTDLFDYLETKRAIADGVRLAPTGIRRVDKDGF